MGLISRVASIPWRRAWQVLNSYDAGNQGRRLRSWIPPSSGPNYAFLYGLDLIRSRSRDAVRNNAWIKKGVETWVSDEIGIGITPRSLAPDDTFRTEADKLWGRWVKQADANGVQNFYGMLSTSARCRIEAGEIFWRRRPRLQSDGLAVPLQYQLLEPEFCPTTENDAIGNTRAGIVFNAIGKRTGYRMYREHPGDPFHRFGTDLTTVPAASIIHHYEPLRAGQIRGIPWTIQALIKARDFDEYDDAELIRKKTRSAYTGAITRQHYDENDFKFDPISGAPIDNANLPPEVAIEAGTWVSLLPGEDVKPFDGDTSGSGYADFVRQALLGVSAGLGVPYEFITGDFKDVNDRLVRVILNAYHRILEKTQWLVTIPQICDPVWVDFVDAAVLSGALTAPGYETKRTEYLAVEWRPYRWDYVHPLQDVQADALRIKEGLASRQQVASERGESAEDIDRQQKEDKDRETELGLKYGADAKKDTAPDEDDNQDETDRKREENTRGKNFRRANPHLYAQAS